MVNQRLQIKGNVEESGTSMCEKEIELKYKMNLMKCIYYVSSIACYVNIPNIFASLVSVS